MAVSHSEGKAAPLQVFDVGAIWRIWEAADVPTLRGERKETGGMAMADVRVARKSAREVILDSILVAFCMLCLNGILEGFAPVEVFECRRYTDHDVVIVSSD